VVWTWAVIASGLLLVLVDQRLKRQAVERDVLAGLLSRFGDLAVTGTELLVGDALTPYPLTEMRGLGRRRRERHRLPVRGGSNGRARAEGGVPQTPESAGRSAGVGADTESPGP